MGRPTASSGSLKGGCTLPDQRRYLLSDRPAGQGPVPTSISCSGYLPSCCPRTLQPSQHLLLAERSGGHTPGSQKKNQGQPVLNDHQPPNVTARENTFWVWKQAFSGNQRMVNNHRSHCPDSQLWDLLQRQAGGGWGHPGCCPWGPILSSSPGSFPPTHVNRTSSVLKDAKRTLLHPEPLNMCFWNSETGLSGLDLPLVPWVSPGERWAPGTAMLVDLRGSTGGRGRDTKSPAQSGLACISPDPTQAITSATARRGHHSLPAWWADKCVRLGSLPAGWNPSSLPTSTASFSCSCGHSACAQGDVRLSEGSLFLSPSHTPLPSGDRVLMAVQTGTSPAGAHWLFS